MRPEKRQMVADIGSLLKSSSYAFFVSYKGLTVKEFSAFRKVLADKQAECHVLSNNLIKKAAEINGMNALASVKLSGDTAVITGQGDAAAVAKAIEEYVKASPKGFMAPKGGVFDGVALTASDFAAIAAMPPKPVLQAQLLGLLQAAPRGLVTVLNAKAASILNVINAYKEKREKN